MQAATLDLAGESWWQAKWSPNTTTLLKSGAKVIFGGGVDSIPSDLGTMLAVGALRGEEDVKVVGCYTEYSGSFSGGTLNSGRAKNKAKREGNPYLTESREADPYLLCGEAQTVGADSPVGTADGMPAGFGWGLRWRQPFFMGPINARVVRRSLALCGLERGSLTRSAPP